MTLAFDGYLHDELCAAGYGFETHEFEMTAQAAAHRHRRRKPHAIEAIVDGHAHIAAFECGSYHDGHQAQGQMPMGHGRAEGSGRGTRRIDMNPLVIAGNRRKLIDARLIDVLPFAGAESRADERLQFN